ncbi:C6 transcription factor [Lasiodiplodia theobromae]|uniref:C6 transcription factor n=1 Tax=Lasiodiplodia theobromae TaxID=45133 RepID=UPI0015C3E6F9|nr:C6 transcription factor [Lasiodiplodia theobromae]KAF4540141.1 C6 transcription factor [Lasiodiplodia theobromae]
MFQLRASPMLTLWRRLKGRGLHCVYRVAPLMNERDAGSQSLVRDLEKRLELAEAENAKLRSSYNALASCATTQSAAGPEHASSTTLADHQPASSTAVPPSAASQSDAAAISPQSEHPGRSAALGRVVNEEVGSPEEGTEIVEVNPHTRDIEFHGHTSSVAFLGRVRQEYGYSEGDSQGDQQTTSQKPSLVSTFYNHAFGTQRNGDASGWNDVLENQFFFPQSYVFLETYFNNLHYIHPFLDKENFYSRCDDLWQGRFQNQSRSFIALYFSLVSLGALIRTWTEEKLNGMGRFEWSRMLFEKAQLALGFPGSANDLEAAQAYIFMAKVCQNELNPNLAYTYLGMASRTLLSIGANRNASIDSGGSARQPQALEASKTWWGFYTLEIELSFALGRPDSLGMDDYHNRPLPPMDGSDVDIIPGMIGLARIMRAISVKVYLHRLSLAQKLQGALNIEMEMDAWVARLPEAIRPQFTSDVGRHSRLGDPPWAYYQRLVLQIRYYNVKMLLLRPFIVHASKYSDERESSLDDAVNKCTDAAARTIDLMYETYRVHTFFHTWWYNITYLTFAASIILYRAVQSIQQPNPQHDYIRLIEQTLSMLDLMRESVVACKTAKVLRQMLAILRQRSGRSPTVAESSVSFTGPKQPAPEQGQAGQGVVGAGLEVPHLGLESLDGCLWDWSFDFRDVWESHGGGFHGLS